MDFIFFCKIIFQALAFLKTHLACWGEKWTVSSLGACPGNFRHQEGRESWLGFAVITQSDIHLLPWKDLERPRDSCLPLIFLSPFFQFYVWLRIWECLSVAGALQSLWRWTAVFKRPCWSWTDWSSCAPRIGPAPELRCTGSFSLWGSSLVSACCMLGCWLILCWKCPASRWGSWGSGSHRSCKWKSRVTPRPPKSKNHIVSLMLGRRTFKEIS